MSSLQDVAAADATIVAAATPPGRGGVAIVRIAGPRVREIGAAMLGPMAAAGTVAATAAATPAPASAGLPTPRLASARRFLDINGEAIDAGLALFFPAPHSYTGDDVLELHAHGGPVLVEALIERAAQLGARRAGPGEFTQRAYLNGKLDLAQAEAVVDLIDAGSTAAARAAVRSLQGEFSERVHALVEAITTLRAWIEAAIDFTDEDVDWLSDSALVERLAGLRAQFDTLDAASRQGRLLTEGLTLVIAGRPNVGKSTLLNRLAGHEAAIVTPIAGTTRDVLRERIHLDGLPLHIVDTAGLRSPGHETVDPVEAEGIRRARAEMARADRILFLVDAVQDPDAAALDEERALLPPEVPVTIVFNKADLVAGNGPEARGTVDANTVRAQQDAIATAAGGTLVGTTQGRLACAPTMVARPPPDRLRISALTGDGVETLREYLKHSAGFQNDTAGVLSARARHTDALARARRHTEAALRQLQDHRAGELVAEELRLAQRTLGEITGEVGTEELLGRIFSTFCIGK